jgi:CheY-like chemotaxis protein
MPASILILFVDDEPLIIEAGQQWLEDGAFAVRPALTADEAMMALESSAQEVSGLIVDVNLRSKLTGWDVARRGRELRPDLSVVYTSGFAPGDWSAQGVPGSLLVPKPYAPAQIVTAISTLLLKALGERRPAAV